MQSYLKNEQYHKAGINTRSFCWCLWKRGITAAVSLIAIVAEGAVSPSAEMNRARCLRWREWQRKWGKSSARRFNHIFEIHMWKHQASSWMCVLFSVRSSRNVLFRAQQCIWTHAHSHTRTHTHTHTQTTHEYYVYEYLRHSHWCKNTQKIKHARTHIHNPTLPTCSCHTHTQINWRMTESLTHRRRLTPCLCMHNTDVFFWTSSAFYFTEISPWVSELGFSAWSILDLR